jgi:hypothetical protein
MAARFISLLPVLVVIGYGGLTGLPGVRVSRSLWMMVAFLGLALGRNTISR